MDQKTIEEIVKNILKLELLLAGLKYKHTCLLLKSSFFTLSAIHPQSNLKCLKRNKFFKKFMNKHNIEDTPASKEILKPWIIPQNVQRIKIQAYIKTVQTLLNRLYANSKNIPFSYRKAGASISFYLRLCMLASFETSNFITKKK